MFLPACWDTPEAAGRRERCRIPDGEHRPSRWQFALDTLDELAGTGLRPAVLVPDTGCGAKADSAAAWRTAAWPTSSRPRAR
ncbi:transposase [Streptomyces xantholiticus]